MCALLLICPRMQKKSCNSNSLGSQNTAVASDPGFSKLAEDWLVNLDSPFRVAQVPLQGKLLPLPAMNLPHRPA